MRNKHADMMIRVAEDTSLKVLCLQSDLMSWDFVRYPNWHPDQKYKIEEPAKPHIHQALIDEAKADPSIEWEVNDESGWMRTHIPDWIPHHKYRKKPRTVDMWQWAYRTDGGVFKTTRAFYATREQADSAWDSIVCKIEGSKITVEIE